MSHHDDHLHDAELGPVIDRLQAERPTASALELDLIKQRVRERVTRHARRSRRTEFMRSRLAILGMLVLGMVLSTGGAGLAVSGFASQNDNAAQTQYGTPTPTPSTTPEGGTKPGNDVLGEEESGGGAGPTENNSPSQPARQVESGAQGTGGEQLPFTGFAAIPILLGGVALLGTGMVLRRRTTDDE
jgi:hypothetical protein